jgi:hypothetical protein
MNEVQVAIEMAHEHAAAREQRKAAAVTNDAENGRDDARLTATDRALAVTDEDRGGDPYNHTGRFKRIVR